MTVPTRQHTPALLQVDAITARLTGRDALAEVCRFLRHEFPHFSWVGIYRADGPLLRLEAFDGDAPTPHETIPLGAGICGLAARENKTVVVPDVAARPEYLACFPETRSELVVPIRSADTVLGEIDIDGNRVGAFDTSDARLVELIAARLSPILAGGTAAAPST